MICDFCGRKGNNFKTVNGVIICDRCDKIRNQANMRRKGGKEFITKNKECCCDNCKEGDE